jgi:hypothetical protein
MGLAAAAPVGTPYLRSPAFAGPSIIYMPQTVTRVLVPGIAPYPSNMMPATQYAYSSAPFVRTDIYVSLPYGTYYWPQGYAGTKPVAPSLPAYVEAPATAIMSAEASYASQRYAPGIGAVQAIAPIVGVVTPGPAMPAATPPMEMLVPIPAQEAPAPAATPASPFQPDLAPPPLAPGVPAPEQKSPFSPDLSIPSLAPTPAPPPPLAPPVSEAPAPGALPSLAPLPVVPSAPGIAMPPAVPSAAPGEIIVDDKMADKLELEPANGWQTSANALDSYEGSSLVAAVDGRKKTATFVADVPEDGEYEVFLWWVASNKEFRPSEVPVTVNAATGSTKVVVDQTANNRMFNSIGKFQFKAGPGQKIVTISTEGVASGPTVNLSVDALKLVKVK